MRRCYGIIPARYASTRLPGKPLVDIAGRPMFWHVYRRAVESGVFTRPAGQEPSLWLATDDERILAAATACDVPCLMTRPEHQSGTDRVFEAAGQLDVPPDAVVVNIQGDEPLLEPALLRQLVEPFADPAVRVSTLAAPVDAVQASLPGQVKVVLAANDDALYFSRSLIPFHRDQDETHTARWWGHIGLYAFRMDALRFFVETGPSSLELTEKLEQLRFLEHGIPIRVVRTEHHCHGVDTPEDLARVRTRLRADSL